MDCKKCGKPMHKGRVTFSNGGISVKNALHTPDAVFYVENVRIDSLKALSQGGWYCGECGVFTVSFNVRKKTASMPIYEKGCDMELDDSVDVLPVKHCPQCGESIDIDYPKCPECGHLFNE